MLELDNIHVAYGRARILHGIHLKVPDHSAVALLGANGAGKTTTLRAISRVLPLSEGKIIFDGEDISALPPSEIVRRGIIHCPEGRQVFPGLNVRENLLLGSYGRGDARVQMDYVLDLFPALRPRLAQFAGTLSGGEQQMLAIGRSLMAEPRLLLLDEPSLGLAPIIVKRIFKVISDFRQHDMSVLLVEQNAALALEIVNEAYGLSHGKISFARPASELRGSDLIRQAYLA